MKRALNVSSKFLKGLHVGVRHQQCFLCMDCGRALSPGASDYDPYHYPECPPCSLTMACVDRHNLRCPYPGCDQVYCGTEAFESHLLDSGHTGTCFRCGESPTLVAYGHDALNDWFQQHNIKCSVDFCGFRSCDTEELDDHMREPHTKCYSCRHIITPTESKRHFYVRCPVCSHPHACIETHNKLACVECGQRGCFDCCGLHRRYCKACGDPYYTCNLQDHFIPCQACNRELVCKRRHAIKAVLLQCEEDQTTCVHCGNACSGDDKVLLRCKKHVRHATCLDDGSTYCNGPYTCCPFDCPLCVGRFGWAHERQFQKCCFCIRRAVNKFQISHWPQEDTTTYCRGDDKMDVDG